MAAPADMPGIPGMLESFALTGTNSWTFMALSGGTGSTLGPLHPAERITKPRRNMEEATRIGEYMDYSQNQ
ncbi:hypothetical protein [Zavarzinella formosa]|uniref:hypothetical protein n=1 Tax=Zavarzinella formosa TaxID=360055 RepID=UPI0012F9CACC|nr:hypothetical protein [Zavarzinella formosa]